MEAKWRGQSSFNMREGGSRGRGRMKMKGVGVGLVNQGGEELERVRSG